MADDHGVLGRLRSRGEELLTQVSAELSSNPRFMQAVAGAIRGKEKVEEGVGRVLRQMNVPTRGELKKATARIDALEREIQALKAKARGASRAKPGARRKAGGKASG
jgi:polyhydroxyalkanoate synthesis regulator phasin